ncbi:MAG: RDD family protein [Myxococcota bacterium]
MTAPGLGARAAARLIDIVGLTLAASWGLLVDFGLVWLIGHALLILLYFVASDALFGATIGKRLLGIRVTADDGSPVSWPSALKREAFVVVGAVPFIGPLVAMALWVGIAVTVRNSPEARGWHDQWSGTRVSS